MKVRISVIFHLFMSNLLISQMNNFEYKIELKNVSDEWYQINLPEDIFGKIKKDYSDIRIFGITEKGDTIEAPYIFRTAEKTFQDKQIDFEKLNSSFSSQGYFYTFRIPSKEKINKINLDFQKNNFDWRVNLKGSHDQKEWFTLLEDYRILAISNDKTHYSFTDLNFPDADYSFYQVNILTNENPNLKTASIHQLKENPGKFKTFTTQISIKKNKTDNLTIIEAKLQKPLPVSELEIFVDEKIDFYRQIQIEYLSDSIKTQNGWKYQFLHLNSDFISSFEPSYFNFETVVAKDFKLTITNNDNQPLNIKKIEAKIPQQYLIARFSKTGKYFLTYGNSKANAPNYDLPIFENRIPNDLKILKLNQEEKIQKKFNDKKDSFLGEKWWLWLIMGVVIVVLAIFTLRMIRHNE